jgi:hypothetical protein
MGYIAHFAFKRCMTPRTGFLFVLTHAQVMVEKAIGICVAGEQVP